MIKCKSKAEYEIKKLIYLQLFGDVLVNERKRIIYLPEDKIYQRMFLNREAKKNERQ